MLRGLNHLTLAVAYLSLGELWLCLSLDGRRAARAGPDYTHYAFDIVQDDFAAFRARLLQAGAVEWRTNKSEGDSFYFLDPDGHQLEAHVGNLASRLAQCRAAPYAGMRFFE